MSSASSFMFLKMTPHFEFPVTEHVPTFATMTHRLCSMVYSDPFDSPTMPWYPAQIRSIVTDQPT